MCGIIHLYIRNKKGADMMRIVEVTVILLNKNQNRIFNSLCDKYNIMHIAISKVTYPTYMMLITTSTGITAVPNGSRRGKYGVETYFGSSVYTLNEFKESVEELLNLECYEGGK